MLSILRVYISAATQQSEGSTDFVVQKLSEIMKSGNDILGSINFKDLQSCLLKLISVIVQKSQHSFEEKNIIANALTLWKCCVFYKPELF